MALRLSAAICGVGIHFCFVPPGQWLDRGSAGIVPALSKERRPLAARSLARLRRTIPFGPDIKKEH